MISIDFTRKIALTAIEPQTFQLNLFLPSLQKLHFSINHFALLVARTVVDLRAVNKITH